MAHTYSQIHIQLVFAVSGRINFIQGSRQDELYSYFGGIFRNQMQKLLAVGGMPDHVHLFFGMRPDLRLSEFVRNLKNFSNQFMKEKGWFGGGTFWQEGYGAFSYSRSHVDRVIRYVLQQEEHHREKSFREEFLSLLRHFGIEDDKMRVFEWYE